MTGRKSQGSRVELVSIRTEDEVLLHGALFEPKDPAPVAALLTHGGWGNFYTGLGRFLPHALAAAGITCLSLNNRGHDYGTVADNEPCIGLMREQFEDSPKDIVAGLRLLKERGYGTLILIGHSYGASKVAYAQYIAPNPDVATLIMCSPAALMKDTWRYYIDKPYSEAVEEARRLVDTGQGDHFVIFRHQGLMPLVSTARTFLSVWGPDTLDDSRKYIGHITKPVLLTVCRRDPVCRDYTRSVYETAIHSEPREFLLFPQGDHYYIGAEKLLEEAILSWISRLGLGEVTLSVC